MAKPKYIVVRGSMGIESAIVFNPIENHVDIANRFGGKQNVLGAGEFRFCYDQKEDRYYLHCSGESVTLGIKSRGWEDAFALKFALFPEGEGVVIDN